MDFKCDELILGKKDADSRALTLLALLGYLVVKVLLPWRAVRRVRARG